MQEAVVAHLYLVQAAISTQSYKHHHENGILTALQNCSWYDCVVCIPASNPPLHITLQLQRSAKIL